MTPKTSPEENLSTRAPASELEFVHNQRRRSSWLAGKGGVLMGIGIGIAIAAGGMVLLSRFRPAASDSQAEAPASTAAAQSVTVAAVERTPVIQTLETTGGSVAASDLLPILPQANGLQIQQVLVDEGDRVGANQVMAVLDHSVLQAQLNQAQAQVVSAQAVVRQKRAAVGQAQATLAEARINQSRYGNLARQGAISRQEAESRDTAAVTGQEQVRLAQADVGSAEAEVQSRRAQVQQLQTQLAQTVVRAPAAGIVAERIARVGDVTGPQKLFSVIRDGALELQVKLPATQLSEVSIGAPVRISSGTDKRIRVQGKVREIAPLVDSQNRQATVEIALPASPLLRPGMFLQATIASGQTQGLTVPAGAVLPGEPPVVYRLAADRAQAQPVEVGETIGGQGEAAARVEIKQGLAPGDRVVVSGAGFLKDGDRVRVVP